MDETLGQMQEALTLLRERHTLRTTADTPPLNLPILIKYRWEEGDCEFFSTKFIEVKYPFNQKIKKFDLPHGMSQRRVVGWCFLPEGEYEDVCGNDECSDSRYSLGNG